MTPLPILKGFDYPPFLIPQENGIEFQLWEEVTYTALLGDSWTIPEGFRTDFATIPAAVSWAVPKLGAYTLAAIVHDLLCVGLNDWAVAVKAVRDEGGFYTHGPEGVWGIEANGRFVPAPTASGKDTDAIFRRIALDHGVDPITANLLWVGVRWGALANTARREGWLSTAPKVIGLSILFAPFVLIPTVFAVVGRGLLNVVRKIRSWVR